MNYREGYSSMEDHLVQKLSRMRRWRKNKNLHRSRSFDFQFTVMTYNILSQTALNHHRYLYQNNRCLGEGFRISRIVPEILRSRSSIVCLQEVEEDLFYQYIQPEMDAKGFSALFKRRTGDKPDGCAILWRRDKFQMVDYWDLELRTADHKLLDRDNVALIGVFRPRARDCRDTLLHVATTHLLFNPKRGDVKLCQLRWLVAELEQMAFRGETPDGDRLYHPVVLCGDFNFQPFSPLYRFVAEGRLELDEGTQYGDLAGQAEAKGKGKVVNVDELSLRKMGISDATRLVKPVSTRPRLVSAVGKHPSDESSKKLKYSKPSGQYPGQDSGDKSSEDIGPEVSVRVSAVGQGSEDNDPMSSDQTEVPAEGQDSDDKKGATFSHDIKFVPAYKFTEDSDELPFTSMTKKTFHTVDHIFYTVNEKKDDGTYTEGKLRLMYTYSLPSPTQGKELGSLPNELLGSDHICLMAQFGLDLRR